jgi:hypothetical protein
MINKIGKDPYRRTIKIDILCVDKIGGLKPLRDLILKTDSFYFVCITLAIIFYVSPFSILSYESYFLILLLIVGVGFFIIGIRTIRKVLKGRIEEEINKINERYQRHHQRLMDRDLEERERTLLLYHNARGYDSITIIEFVCAVILPLVAFLRNFYTSIKFLF